MKISGYQAFLNSGRVIDADTRVGEKLQWDSLHWSSSANTIRANDVAITETADGLLLQAQIGISLQAFTETMCFREINPIEIDLEEEADSNILAFYFFKDWWTRPAFVSSFGQVPDETSVLFYHNARGYHFLMALPGQVFRSHFVGKDGRLKLILSADASGYCSLKEDAMIAVTEENPYLCFEKGMRYACRLYQIPMREGRSYPDIMEKIGWCSWDAFYKEVSAAGIEAKAAEIRDKDIPFGWILIDDGWQDVRDDRMVSYRENRRKFPEGLSGTVQQIREMTGITHVGVWHAFSGYWCGIDPEGELAQKHPKYFIESHQGKLLPKPDAKKAEKFYGKWYKYLNKQGIDFVKVDSQSSTRQHYRTNTPIGTSSAALHRGLDLAAEKYMKGNLINCMGMAQEDILQRPISGLSRNSDDFFPLEEKSFREHLLENAYNGLYHNHVYYGDWDMFWSSHPYAGKHALLRALSGGPVYVSDRVGETKKEVLMPLCYSDGTILRAEQGAVPTVDCLLADPEENGYLKLQNHLGKAGYLAIYSYKEQAQTLETGIKDLTQLPVADEYAVFQPLSGEGFMASSDSCWECHLDPDGYDFYQIMPVTDGKAVFGLADKYLSSHAIISEEKTAEGLAVTLRASAPLRVYSKTTPACSCNGVVLEVRPEKAPGFYRIMLPEESGTCTVLIQ